MRRGLAAPAVLALIAIAGCGGSGGGGGGTAATTSGGTSPYAKTGQAFPNVITFAAAKTSLRYPDGFRTIGTAGPTARIIQRGGQQCTAAVVGPLPDVRTDAKLADYLRHPPGGGLPGPAPEVRSEQGADVRGATSIRRNAGPNKITSIGALFQNAGNGLAINCTVPGPGADDFDRQVFRPMAATATIPIDEQDATIQGKLLAIDGVQRAGVRTVTTAGPASISVQLVAGSGTTPDAGQKMTAAALLAVAQTAPKQPSGVNLSAGSEIAGIGTLKPDGSGNIVTPPGGSTDFASQSELEKLAK